MTIDIADGALSAALHPLGAQLSSLHHRGRPVLWGGDAAVWGWHAPNLFPIVGRLAGGRLVHRGRSYPMAQHGFLRRSECRLVESGPAHAVFRLEDDAASRRQYPFAFRLDIAFAVADGVLAQHFTLTNTGDEILPASIGAHPAFAWPLAAASRAGARLTFERPEPGPVRRLEAGLLSPEPRPSPVEGRVLALADALFDEDALIFDKIASRAVTYADAAGSGVEIRFPDFPQFGVWTKPGGSPFLCLEPWAGHADPAGFSGEILEKPGMLHLAPGQARRLGLTIRPFGPAS